MSATGVGSLKSSGSRRLSDASKDLVRRHFEEIWNQRDLAACDEIMADDYVEHAFAPFAHTEPGAVNGPEHMRGVVEWLLTQFPDLRMTIEAIVADGDTVAARVLSEGTNLGKLNGVMPRPGSASLPVRATGTGSRTESSPSIGRLATISRRCSNSARPAS